MLDSDEQEGIAENKLSKYLLDGVFVNKSKLHDLQPAVDNLEL